MARVEIRWNEQGLADLVKQPGVQVAARAHGEAIASVAKAFAPTSDRQRTGRYRGYREGIKVLWGRGLTRIVANAQPEPGCVRFGVAVAATDFKSHLIEYGTKGSTGTVTKKQRKRLATTGRRGKRRASTYVSPPTPALAILRRAASLAGTFIPKSRSY
jgi:hypothetical protein